MVEVKKKKFLLVLQTLERKISNHLKKKLIVTVKASENMLLNDTHQ